MYVKQILIIAGLFTSASGDSFKKGAVIVLATPYSGSQLYILILTFITAQLVLLENFLVQESVPPTLILLSLYIHLTYLEDPDRPHTLD